MTTKTTKTAKTTKTNQTLYQVENSWGGTTGHQGGKWVIGGRPSQGVVALDIKSDDGGKTLTGTMTYEGEGPIGFTATLFGSNNYTVENSWGGTSGHDGGNWVIGYRSGQNVVAVNVTSKDGGKTLSGTMTYEGEGPIGFEGTQAQGDAYSVENSWGGTSGHQGGTWALGNRSGQNVVALDIKSDDGGETLSGTMTYSGEGPIGFKGALSGSNNYTVENSWGGTSGHDGGLWIIGLRAGQNVVAVEVTSTDDGKTLSGTMTYDGEGPIGFEGTLLG